MAGFSMPHPGWVAIGIVMIGIGIWLIRWANRNNMIATMTDATTEAAISAMRKPAARICRLKLKPVSTT